MARSLYEAVARGLHILRQNDRVDGIHQNSTITIAVKEPEVEHRFESRTSKTGSRRVEGLLLNKRLRAICELFSAPELSRNRGDEGESLFGDRCFDRQVTRILVVTNRDELRMPQVVAFSPFRVFDLRS